MAIAGSQTAPSCRRPCSPRVDFLPVFLSHSNFYHFVSIWYRLRRPDAVRAATRFAAWPAVLWRVGGAACARVYPRPKGCGARSPEKSSRRLRRLRILGREGADLVAQAGETPAPSFPPQIPLLAHPERSRWMTPHIPQFAPCAKVNKT